jgi:predicted transcriptional regulator
VLYSPDDGSTARNQRTNGRSSACTSGYRRDRGWFFANIAEKVAERRLEKNLSQRELAERCGTTQSAIARLERGGRPPRIDTRLRIAEALECELVVDLVPR